MVYKIQYVASPLMKGYVGQFGEMKERGQFSSIIKLNNSETEIRIPNYCLVEVNNEIRNKESTERI